MRISEPRQTTAMTSGTSSKRPAAALTQSMMKRPMKPRDVGERVEWATPGRRRFQQECRGHRPEFWPGRPQAPKARAGIPTNAAKRDPV
jgi:hypothetical protein